MLKFLALLLLSSPAFAQTCTITGPAGYSGSIAQCPACLLLCSGSPAPPPPPPVTGCDASQTSYAGQYRVCSGSVTYPQRPVLSFSGDLVDANRLLSGTWGAYKASGNSFTINIPAGAYVSFALKATDATHGLQWVVNQTFGANGHFWISDTPGGVPRGQCNFTNNTNAMLYPFPGYLCSIPLQQTVYVNFADGQPVAYGVY